MVTMLPELTSADLGYLAGMIDAFGHIHIVYNRQTRKYDPILRLSGRPQQMISIAQRFPNIFAGPYVLSKRQAYLTMRQVNVLWDVLVAIIDYLFINKEIIEKILPFVEFRKKYLYSREYPKTAELQYINQIRSVTR